MWQLRCRCIATWGRPTPRQSSSTLITTPMPSLKSLKCSTYPLPSYSVLSVDTLRYVVTLTFDFWPWIFVVYRLWPDETLYQIWVKSSNPRRNYCNLNVWPYDRVSRAKLSIYCGITFTKLKISKGIRSWNVTIFCWWNVMSHWDLDLWPLDLENLLYIKCHVEKVCTKFERNRAVRG